MPRERQISWNLSICVEPVSPTRAARTGRSSGFTRKESHIRMMVGKDSMSYKIDMHLRKNKAKGVAINGLPIKKARELLGVVNLVFFSPEDLNIIKNGPGERRRFMDAELCQLNKLYLTDLAGYNHVLNQRNKLLKDMYKQPELEATLDVWDMQLANYGRKIIDKRREFVDPDGDIKEIHRNSPAVQKILISLSHR